MTRIAVTGASGQYGRLATDKLIALGRARDLILITRTPPKLAERERAGCDVRYGDFDQPDTLVAAVRGAEKMLLISGTRVGARVRQHRAAIDAAAAAGVRHVVYTSFVNVEPSNPAIVTVDHRETERLIRACARRGGGTATRATTPPNTHKTTPPRLARSLFSGERDNARPGPRSPAQRGSCCPGPLGVSISAGLVRSVSR